MQLKEALALYGRATNQNSAWGYSPHPVAERLADGKIKVTTYHTEGEWRDALFDTPEEVDLHLYSESDTISASSKGKTFKAQLTVEETGFVLSCTINGESVSLEEYKRAFPQEMKEIGEPWLPGYWDGPGEWE